MKITAYILTYIQTIELGGGLRYHVSGSPFVELPPGAKQYKAVWELPDPVKSEQIPEPLTCEEITEGHG